MGASAFSSISWGLRHRKWYVRVYTYASLAWLAFSAIVAAVIVYERGPSPVNIAAGVFVAALLGLPPLAVLSLLRRREMRRTVKTMVLDPYLVSAIERVRAVEDYFRGKTYVSWSPVISMVHDATLSVLQRMLIDLKGGEGVAMIEQMRRERRLYLSTLAKILREAGVISEEELKEIEILRDLRNRVVHEDYHPSREQALWALNFIKNFIRKHYPNAM